MISLGVMPVAFSKIIKPKTPIPAKLVEDHLQGGKDGLFNCVEHFHVLLFVA